MIRFILPLWADHSFTMNMVKDRQPVVVTLSIEKIEQAWKKQGKFHGYVGVGGKGGKLYKYDQVRAWLEKNNEIYMPLLSLTVDCAEAFRFHDGRHTFAFLRDSGYQNIEFAVPLDKKDIFVAHYAPND